MSTSASSSVLSSVFGRISAKRVVFVIDVSEVMGVVITTPDGSLKTRLEYVASELVMLLQAQTSSTFWYDVIVFCDMSEALFGTWASNDASSIEETADFLKTQQCKGSNTCFSIAIQAAFSHLLHPDIEAIHLVCGSNFQKDILECIPPQNPIPIHTTFLSVGLDRIFDEKSFTCRMLHLLAYRTGGVFRLIDYHSSNQSSYGLPSSNSASQHDLSDIPLRLPSQDSNISAISSTKDNGSNPTSPDHFLQGVEVSDEREQETLKLKGSAVHLSSSPSNKADMNPDNLSKQGNGQIPEDSFSVNEDSNSTFTYNATLTSSRSISTSGQQARRMRPSSLSYGGKYETTVPAPSSREGTPKLTERPKNSPGLLSERFKRMSASRERQNSNTTRTGDKLESIPRLAVVDMSTFTRSSTSDLSQENYVVVTSHDPANKLSMELDHHSVVAGDTITGRLKISFVNCFFVKRVVIEVHGTEKVEIKGAARRATAPSTSTSDLVKEKLIFHKEETILSTNEAFYTPGTRYLQFSSVIPHFCPSSFSTNSLRYTGSASLYSAKISYKVIARVEMAINYSLTTKIHFRVSQIPQPPEKIGEEVMTRGLHTMLMKASLDKFMYNAGDQGLVRCEFNNLSTAESRFWKVTLEELLSLRYEGQKMSTSNLLFQEVFEGFPQFYYGERLYPFSLATNLLPTVETTFIQHKYILHVEAESSFISNITVSLPLYVHTTSQDSNQSLTKTQSTRALEILHRPRWQRESEVSACGVCLDGFGVLRRKHHCRHCGVVVCAACSRNETQLPQLGFHSAVRICDKCMMRVQAGEVGFHTPSRYLDQLNT
eukprot:TRINITY_DN6805_c0_g1_i7.p1 TRINITY_DN6805_c0_g1~~TRINITY_DN6805_c0_g1_i7.p1  ORF type:complete len:828 (+),score=120.18 TRINITY_DN6805_c0_g1_i7:1145-3628(+)